MDNGNKLRGILGQDVLLVSDNYQTQSHKVSKANIHFEKRDPRIKLRNDDEVIRLKRSNINFSAQDYGPSGSNDYDPVNNMRNSRSIPMQKNAAVAVRPKPLATEVGRRSSSVI